MEGHSSSATLSASAALFRRSEGADGGWALAQPTVPPDGADLGRFGPSVALSGALLVAGAPHMDQNASSAGKAYVFAKAPSAPAVTTADMCGIAVATDGKSAVVGAEQKDAQGFNSGSVHVSGRGPGGADSHGRFGSSVAVSGEYVVAGAYENSGIAIGPGSASVLGRDIAGSSPWGLAAMRDASNGDDNDSFGRRGMRTEARRTSSCLPIMCRW